MPKNPASKRLSPEQVGQLVRVGLPDSIAAGARAVNRGKAGRQRSKTPTIDRILSAGETKQPDVAKKVEESFLSGTMKKLRDAGSRLFGGGKRPSQQTPAAPSGPRAPSGEQKLPRRKGGGLGLSAPGTKVAMEELERTGAFGGAGQLDSLRAQGRKIREGG